MVCQSVSFTELVVILGTVDRLPSEQEHTCLCLSVNVFLCHQRRRPQDLSDRWVSEHVTNTKTFGHVGRDPGLPGAGGGKPDDTADRAGPVSHTVDMCVGVFMITSRSSCFFSVGTVVGRGTGASGRELEHM